MEYEPIRAVEFNRMQALSRTRFEALLGKLPSYKQVASTLPNPHKINALHWAAFLVLLVLTVFTSFKVGAAAVPYGRNIMQALTLSQYIDTAVQDTFIYVTVLLFTLMATPALIYFKLLDRDDKTVAEKRRTQRGRWGKYILSLDWITPRLPGVLVYGIALWLIVLSSNGLTFDGTIVNQVGRVFEVYLPVGIEIGLAYLVGDIIEKRQKFDELVRANMREQSDAHKKQLADMETDRRYLKLLYQVMREGFLTLERSNGRTKFQPNKTWEGSPQLDSFIMAEYKRLTSGDEFAHKLLTPIEVVEPLALPITTKRVPPNGAKEWTVNTLTFDLKQRGVPASYNEKSLTEDYEAGYKVRPAWRNGAKNFFGGGST